MYKAKLIKQTYTAKIDYDIPLFGIGAMIIESTFQVA